jgi:hypothetical protein
VVEGALAQKLKLRPGSWAAIIDAPEDFLDEPKQKPRW